MITIETKLDQKLNKDYKEVKRMNKKSMISWTEHCKSLWV